MEISLFEVFCSLISQFNFSIDCPAVPDLAKFWCRKISLQVEFIVNNLMMTFRMKYGCLPDSIVKLGCDGSPGSKKKIGHYMKKMYQEYVSAL